MVSPRSRLLTRRYAFRPSALSLTMSASHAIGFGLIALDFFGATCQATRLATSVLGTLPLCGILSLGCGDDVHVSGRGRVVGVGGGRHIVLGWGTEEEVRHGVLSEVGELEEWVGKEY